MSRLRFAGFLAPHHPLGESPTLQLQRDLELVTHLDKLGYDEFWCGEHHSTGWEVIGSPEMFLASAAMVSQRIMLGTGVVSLPYHHPFNVAQRIVQLDQVSRGRAMFGSGPGALPSDAFMLGIDPMTQRTRQDEAMGVIIRLLRGERFSYHSDWFELHDAGLQILPVQEDMMMATASTLSPSGMQIAGKHGIGVLSIASSSSEGLQALTTQWRFAEEAATQHGKVVDRSQWRVMMNWHIAETREQARAEALQGLHRWHNEYNVSVLARPGATHVADPVALMDQMCSSGATVIGTPDDLIAAIRAMQERTGGFGTVMGFVHDWANRENTLRSWDLVARYVIPELTGALAPLRASAAHVTGNQGVLMKAASRAVAATIYAHEGATAALEVTKAQMAAAAAARQQTEFRPGAGLPVS